MSSITTQSRPIITKSSDIIRQQVDSRHWQLFETRLKTSLIDNNQDNYTKSNDYRIIDRLKKIDRTQIPIEPDQRWKQFCSQLTTKTNESSRVMSIFHNVWIKNWNMVNNQTKTISNENTFPKSFLSNERDKKVISSILHQVI
ncbi:hypothetical protein I4U23_026437 [Adineta vaga]|nr:hypothetical protein I4U23_026437 [Adineta vaga]